MLYNGHIGVTRAGDDEALAGVVVNCSEPLRFAGQTREELVASLRDVVDAHVANGPAGDEDSSGALRPVAYASHDRATGVMYIAFGTGRPNPIQSTFVAEGVYAERSDDGGLIALEVKDASRRAGGAEAGPSAVEDADPSADELLTRERAAWSTTDHLASEDPFVQAVLEAL